MIYFLHPFKTKKLKEQQARCINQLYQWYYDHKDDDTKFGKKFIIFVLGCIEILQNLELEYQPKTLNIDGYHSKITFYFQYRNSNLTIEVQKLYSKAKFYKISIYSNAKNKDGQYQICNTNYITTEDFGAKCIEDLMDELITDTNNIWYRR